MELSRWAFGVNGIPSLQVIAFGDFSYDNRFKSENKILCRQPWSMPNSHGDTSAEDMEQPLLSYRPIRDSDIMMMELVRENIDFLGACPVDSIYINADEAER